MGRRPGFDPGMTDYSTKATFPEYPWMSQLQQLLPFKPSNQYSRQLLSFESCMTNVRFGDLQTAIKSLPLGINSKEAKEDILVLTIYTATPTVIINLHVAHIQDVHRRTNG
jgi:hypothetical protein